MDWWLIIQILFLFCVVFTLFEITLDIHTDQKYKRRNKLETQEEYWRQQKMKTFEIDNSFDGEDIHTTIRRKD